MFSHIQNLTKLWVIFDWSKRSKWNAPSLISCPLHPAILQVVHWHLKQDPSNHCRRVSIFIRRHKHGSDVTPCWNPDIRRKAVSLFHSSDEPKWHTKSKIRGENPDGTPGRLSQFTQHTKWSPLGSRPAVPQQLPVTHSVGIFYIRKFCVMSRTIWKFSTTLQIVSQSGVSVIWSTPLNISTLQTILKMCRWANWQP